MQTKGKIISIANDISKKINNEKGYIVTFETDYIDDLLDIQTFELDIKMSKARKHRSKDQNRLLWEFIDKIAAKTGCSRTEVYQNEIRDVGGVSEIHCLQNEYVESSRKRWESLGLGWTTETLYSKIEGCTNVVYYYGSSVFTTEQMNRLIDLVMQDAEALGIDTTPLSEVRLYERN